VQKAWLNSPTHRSNIMNNKFTEIGIATAVGTYKGRKTTFVVQMFGTPAAQAAPTPTPVPVAAPERNVVAIQEQPEESVLGTESSFVETSAEPEEIAVVTEPVTTPAVEEPPEEVAPEVSGPTALSAATSWTEVVTSPRTMLRALYMVLGLFLIGFLLARARFEFRQHHVHHAQLVLLVIALMIGLFFVADVLLFSTPIVGAG